MSADSRLARARRQTGASMIAVRAVRHLMSDKYPRTDEEITDVLNEYKFQVEIGRDKRWSQDSVRHARLALELAGILRLVPDVGKCTRNGGRASVWVLA